MKRAVTVLILILCAACIWAVDFEFSAGYNVRLLSRVSVSGSAVRGDFAFSGKEKIEAAFSWRFLDLPINRMSFSTELFFVSQVFDFKAVTASLGLCEVWEFRPGIFLIRLTGGFYSSVLKSKYLQDVYYALTPVLGAELGLDVDNFNLCVYVDAHSLNDFTWRSTTVYGIRTGFDVNESLGFEVDAWAHATEFLVDNWRMIDSIGVRAAVRYSI